MNEALDRYLDVVRRSWRIVATIMLLCVGGTALLLVVTPPTYESAAFLFVSTPRDDESTAYRGDEYSRERLSTYAVLGASPELAQRVINDVGLTVSPATLIGRTKTAVVPSTVLISVTTTAETPTEAHDVAQAYVEELTRSVAALEAVPGGLTPRAELVLVQPPSYEPTPAGFPAWILLGVAGVAGLILSSFVIVVASVLSGRVRTPGDAVEAIDAPVLASFEFSSNASIDSQLDHMAEPARALRNSIARSHASGKRTILLCGVEQASAKAPVAAALGRALAAHDASVVLVSFDPEFDALLDSSDAPTVTTLMETFETGAHTARTQASHVLDSADLRQWHGFAVLPLGKREDAGYMSDDTRIRGVLRELAARFEWVLVTTRPIAVCGDAIRLAGYSDGAIVAVQPGKTKFDDLKDAGRQLGRAGLGVGGIVLIDRVAVHTPSNEAAIKEARTPSSKGTE